MKHEVEGQKTTKNHRPSSSAEPGASSASERPPGFELQHYAGNQAMQALLRGRFIQAKLAISQPDDPEEQEADATAGRIMRSHAGAGAAASSCSCGDDEEGMCDACRQTAAVSRKAAGDAGVSSASAHRVLDTIRRSPGHAMDAATRAFFEPRFGQDFSGVRVHTDAAAAASAQSIRAHAYAAGEHLVFNAGAYAPESDAGRRLLAHELTHVVQQRGVNRALADEALSRPSEVPQADDAAVANRQSDQVKARDKHNGGIPQMMAGSADADLFAGAASADVKSGTVMRQAHGADAGESATSQATTASESGPVSELQPAPVVVQPTSLNFDRVEGEVDAPLEVQNISQAPVVLDYATINGGDKAFSVLMLSGKTIPPGKAARLAVEYHPGPHPVEKAFLTIALTTGEQVYVDIVPPSQNRALAATKAGVLKIAPDPVMFAEVNAPSAKNQYDVQGLTEITITNPSLTPQQIDHIQFSNDKVGKLSVADPANWKPMTVAPGATEMLRIAFLAEMAGDLSGTGRLMTADDRVIATFEVRAHVESTEWMNELPKDALAQAEKTWKPTDDAKVRAVRDHAKTALAQLMHNAGATLTNAMNSLRDEWLEYLQITASNPSISGDELGGESLLGQVLEHTLAGGAAKGAEHKIEHIAHAAHGAAHGADEAVGHAGSEAAKHAAAKTAGEATAHAAEEEAAEAGLLIGGAVAGFAIGVLIETVGGLIYHWLSGEDEEIRKKIEEAYQEGFQAGKRVLYEALKSKTAELDEAEHKAAFYEYKRELDYMRLIGSTTSLKNAEKIDAEIQAEADRADPATAKIEKGLTQLLLQRWARAHAADPTHAAGDVQQEDWVKATRGAADREPSVSAQYWLGNLGNMPDLFVDQAMHEWTERGLNPSPELGTKMRTDIGTAEKQPADMIQAEHMAARALSLFGQREFVFRPGLHYDSAKSPFLEASANDTVKTVSCYLDLHNRKGTCFVSEFMYYLEMADGSVVRGTVAPGGGPLKTETAREASEREYSSPERKTHGILIDRSGYHTSEQLYGLLIKLQDEGFNIAQQSGDSGSFLKETFGIDTGYAAVQEGTGAKPSLAVFHILDDVVLTYNKADAKGDEKALDPETIPPVDQMRSNPPYLMVRGGDTIIWMKARMAGRL